MKIAISTEGEFVSPHFGRCSSFTILDIEDGKLINREIIDNPGHQPGFLPQFLHGKGIEYIIAGGMGQRASELFNQVGIKAIVGISGKIDDVIDQLLKGSLKGGENICRPGAGRGYGVEKAECEHPEENSEGEEL